MNTSAAVFAGGESASQEAGAQFAARQHLQTVKVQADVIAGQARDIDKISKQVIEAQAECVRLATVLRAEQGAHGATMGELAALRASMPGATDWRPYHSALSQCAELLDNMGDGDSIFDTPKYLAAKLARPTPSA